MPSQADPAAALPTDIDELAALRDCLTVVDGRYISAKSEDGQFELLITWDTQEPDDHGWAIDMRHSGKTVDSDALDTERGLDNAISWLRLYSRAFNSRT